MTAKLGKLFWTFTPFWLYLVLFKFGGALQYSLVSPFGEQFLPIWLVGFLMGGASLVQLIFDVPAGHLLDRFGYRRLLLIGTIGYLVGTICLAFSFTLPIFLVLIVSSIVGWQFFGPGANAYILSLAPKDDAGRFLSYRDAFGAIGVMLASGALPLALLIAPSAVGILLSVVLVAACIAIALSPKDKVSVHAEKKIETHHHYVRREFLSLFKMLKQLNPASAMLLLQNVVASAFYGVIWFTVPLMLVHQAESGIWLGLGLGVFDFAIVIIGFLLGTVVDRADKRTLVFFGLLIFAIAGMFLGLGFGVFFILFGFLATTGDEIAGLSLWSWLHALDKDHANDGKIAGIITLFEDIGWMIGPPVAGILYTLIGPSWTIVVGALPIFAVWLIYWMVFDTKVMKNLDFSLVPAKPHRKRHKG